MIKYGSIIDAEYDDIPYIAHGKESKGTPYLRDGDVIIADTAEDETVGKCCEIVNINDTKVESGLHTIPCRPMLAFAPMYLGYYMNSYYFHKQLFPLMQGVKVLSISKGNIGGTLISFPYSYTEQKKIVDLLHLIDIRIRKLQQIIEALKKYKRGVLRTVFSEKGNHSLLRDATSHRIDEICDVLSGKRIPKGETFSPRPTEYRYITVSDMGEKYVCSDALQFITSHTEKQIARYKVKNGDIIISVAGTLGKLNIITPDLDGVNLTENCDRFTNFRGINPEYLYHVLSSDLIQSQIEASKTKNGQPKLALERIRNFVVPVPHQKRQEQFVGVMNSIDKYIASQQAILDRCCKVRAGLLQQLFI